MNLWQETDNDSVLPSQRKVKRPQSPNGSHGVTLTQTKQKTEKSQRVNVQSTEIALTVRIANKSLTIKHFRLILECLIYEIVTDGCTLARMLLLVHLYQQLMGSKPNPVELNDQHTRRLCLLSEIIIKDLSDKDFDHELPVLILTESLRKDIIESNLIMTRRTYMSRKGHWRPENWLIIRPVGIDSLIERNGNSERYSGYCKGYGESHPSAHYKKTKPSAELDGKEAQDQQPIRLKELCELIILNKLNLKPKKVRRQS